MDEIPRGKCGASERHPLAVGRCIDEHARTIQDRSVKNVRTDDASRVKPLGPGHAIIEVQQRQFKHVAWLLQARGQRGAANCEQMFGAELCHMQSWPVAVAVTSRDVHVFAGEIDVMQRARYPEVDFGMHLSKPAESMDEPLGGEIR